MKVKYETFNVVVDINFSTDNQIIITLKKSGKYLVLSEIEFDELKYCLTPDALYT